MFDRFIKTKLALDYEDRVLVFDYDKILSDYKCMYLFENSGFNVIFYNDIEKFRYLYETEIKVNQKKYLIIINDDIYLPYDIRMSFYNVDISFEKLFPRLNSFFLKNYNGLDFDLLHIANQNLYKNIISEKETRLFLEKEMYSKENVEEYIRLYIEKVNDTLEEDLGYKKWFDVALYKAKINNAIYKVNLDIDIEELNSKIAEAFSEFILKDYKKLSGISYYKAPVMLNKCLDYIFLNNAEKQQKNAIIVMDGMALENWLTIANEFRNINYKTNLVFALIPTITSVSRQSLLSGKLPVELETPFNLSKEKKLFTSKCIENGYRENQIKYYRGYDIDISMNDKCICVIINDVDDLVHGQIQGKQGMYNDISYLANTNKIQKLIEKLCKGGFNVYITSDHGNTNSICIGNPRGNGVEVESKCKRALIYKDFADYKKIKEKYNLIEYPAAYLQKEYNYLICETSESFGVKGQEIMTHGGINIEEVIVPFVTIDRRSCL